MKALKILGIIILILIAIFFIVPAFLSNNAEVNRSVQIDATSQLVFRQVNNTTNYIKWSPFETDSTIVNTFDGPKQGVGAARHWDGEKAGKGTMTIIESDPYKYVLNKLIFGDNDGGGFGTWNFSERDDGTHVTWSISVTNLAYLEKWAGLIMPFSLGPMLESGLKSLKELAESLPVPPVVTIIETSVQPSLVVYDSTTVEGMKDMFENSYTTLMTYVNKAKLPVTGPRLAVYHDWNPEGYTHISAGIGVGLGMENKGKGPVTYLELPAGKTVFATHTGGFNTGAAHYAIEDYIKDFNLEMNNFIWETYNYNPRVQTDSSAWVTNIYYPVK